MRQAAYLLGHGLIVATFAFWGLLALLTVFSWFVASGSDLPSNDPDYVPVWWQVFFFSLPPLVLAGLLRLILWMRDKLVSFERAVDLP
ncbi:MAG: hypothetical protein JO290_13985 [Sphingomonadaceae bacterium]|nr:hypothetical protein [Sphingomonadaceae bacterium]